MPSPFLYAALGLGAAGAGAYVLTRPRAVAGSQPVASTGAGGVFTGLENEIQQITGGANAVAGNIGNTLTGIAGAVQSGASTIGSLSNIFAGLGGLGGGNSGGYSDGGLSDWGDLGDWGSDSYDDSDGWV